MKSLRKILLGFWIGTILTLLLAGALLCVPPVVPFATVLLVTSSVLFFAFGMLLLFAIFDAL